MDVLIVGAGLAGLVAARQLRRRRVAIFEGRDRLGGRVRTIRDGFVGRVHAEAGGEFVDEGQESICRLVHELGLKLARVLRSGFGEARLSRGRMRLLPSVSWDAHQDRLKPLVDAFKSADRRWDGPVARDIARRSIAEFAPGLDWIRGLLGADAGDLSLLVLVELAASMEKPPGKQKFFRIAGGADRLVEKLAAPLKSSLHLGRRVVAIRQDAHGVRVAVRGADGLIETVTASHVIVTAPAPLVAEIAFDPRVPQPQWRAIKTLRYGPSTKTHLEFERPFWRRPGRPRAFATSLPVGAVWDGSEAQASKSSLLTLLAGGSASAATQRLLAEGKLLRKLEWLGRGRLLSRHSVSWEAYPWARGAYAYFDPNYDPALRPLLAHPFGRVFFAGEHTSLMWPGYMNGAVESGLRAANEVLAMTTPAGRRP